MTSPRILLLRHFEVDPRVNGFTARYDVVVKAARTFAMVEEATVGGIGSGATVEVDDAVFTTSRRGRLSRLRAACGLGGPYARAAKTLNDFVATKKVVAVFGCTYRSPELYSRVARRVPTYMFVEERTRAFGYGETVSLSIRSRVIATVERSGLRRLLGKVRAVVVINAHEVAAATRRWRRPVVVVPHAIEQERFVGQRDSALAVQILTVGNYAERRNADGLRQFLEALRARADVPPLSVAAISATGFADELVGYFDDHVEGRVGVADLGPSYASAHVVIVPSFATSGSKTTILQGWAAERPVVSTRASAESVGAIDRYDVLIGDTGEELVARCVEILEHAPLAESLIAHGTESLGLRHSESAVRTALLAMLGDDWESRP